jgi:DNA-binding IclR family transcriptional regulator
MLAGEIERILGGSADGMSTSAIAEQGGAESSQVLTLLRDLEKAGEVRRTGERRGTRWHLITDEDRIAERAAELASRSKANVSPE